MSVPTVWFADVLSKYHKVIPQPPLALTLQVLVTIDS
jgi:hypothetical protein